MESFNPHILKTKPPNDNLSAQVCFIEDSFKRFKSRPYLTSHVTRIDETLKHESHLNPRVSVSVNRLRMFRCLMLVSMGFITSHYHRSYEAINTLCINRPSTEAFLFYVYTVIPCEGLETKLTKVISDP